MVGGGSLPGETLPSWVWALKVNHAQRLLELLRRGNPAVIGRIENDQVIFDPRTILIADDPVFIEQFEKAWSEYEN